MTLSQALIGEAIPPRERGRYQGYLAGVAVSSSTFGPVAGGYLKSKDPRSLGHTTVFSAWKASEVDNASSGKQGSRLRRG